MENNIEPKNEQASKQVDSSKKYKKIKNIFFIVIFAVVLVLSLSVSIGIFSWIAYQACVNMGMVMGIFPVVGIPLPFVSYGGSSLLFTSFAVGVLLNISAQTDMHPRAARTAPPVPAGLPTDDKTVKVY